MEKLVRYSIFDIQMEKLVRYSTFDIRFSNGEVSSIFDIRYSIFDIQMEKLVRYSIFKLPLLTIFLGSKHSLAIGK